MKQHVDITLVLSLWLDARMDEGEIVTHVRASLPDAFGEELTAMLNPVDILVVHQEAELYGSEDGGLPVGVYKAAPELFEALEYFFNIMHDYGSSVEKGYVRLAMEQARKALARARSSAA